MILFLDTEFTNLRQSAHLISLALVSTCGKSFYAVFEDWSWETCSDFVKEGVISKLDLTDKTTGTCIIKGGKKEIVAALKEWLDQFEEIQIWADVPHYDWVLFCELFGGALHIPQHIHYMCMDLATLLLAKGYNHNETRINLISNKEHPKHYKIHNALSDATLGMTILKKLLNKE
ncbi:MAG: hypothetical protein CSA95_07845 [Bacteroidetes bacterium]|nr:MAG: hypothetical protein CSA95_07845 [Bacteroidota bacterium]